MSERLSFRDRVAAYFRARPNVWIDGDAFRNVGGKYAYRTRISECRTTLQMEIDHRLRRIGSVVISEYMFIQPIDKVSRDELQADLNAWDLR
jgi:hypothetical protein